MKTFTLTIGAESVSRDREDVVFDAIVDDWCYDHGYYELESPPSKEEFMLNKILNKIKRDVICGRRKKYDAAADISVVVDL